MMFLSFCTLSLKLGSSLTDCSHLPPEQRRKKLLARIKNLNQEIQREREQRPHDLLPFLLWIIQMVLG
ncbi:Formin-binding protein 1-like [Ilyodon furcidens]|uniref:Formin-binding protein 1-like n=1 Tax=Ilyodon furcidens TaxID=33524 RepID=A0ABV0UYE5_9TELE